MNDKSHAATPANATSDKSVRRHLIDSPSLVVTGGWGKLICNVETGNVLSYEHSDSDAYGADEGYHDIVKIDIPTFRKQWIYPDVSEVDILYVGYWLKDGRYEPPAVIAAQAVPLHAETVGERLKRIYPEHYVTIITRMNAECGPKATAMVLSASANDHVYFGATLSSVFLWDATPEGHEFWEALAKREGS